MIQDTIEIKFDLPESLLKEGETKYNDFAETASERNVPVPVDPEFTAILKRVFSFSEFVAKTCALRPDILDDLFKSGDFGTGYEKDACKKRIAKAISDAKAANPSFSESDLGILLRDIRRREMVRIAFRDLAGLAGLGETISDLSDFADACIDCSVAFLEEKFRGVYGVPTGPDGVPQNLVVLAMGKLGAGELNFSSDIDLIFAYPEAGETVGTEKTTTNEDFFVRLGRSLVKVLGENTAGGVVFRVDMDLRPFGGGGPLVMHFDAMEEYYSRHGREWERYALIKARSCKCGKAAGEVLLKTLQPFVYRKYLDYGVFESIREMKRNITLEVKRKGMKNNVKLGPGGIREIEFFGQVFQLIRGGVEPALRERRILKILDTLAREKYITNDARDELKNAYVFLRHVENRLQEYSDRQTHALPTDETGRLRLAVSMGFPGWEQFEKVCKTHTANVHRLFLNLLKETETKECGTDGDFESIWLNILEKEQAECLLSDSGYEKPAEVLELLGYLRDSPAVKALSAEGRKRLDGLIPAVLKETGVSRNPMLALNRIVDLIRSIGRRTNYFSLLLENPDVMAHLVRLANESSWILAYLSRHPLLLDELFDYRLLYSPPDRTELETELRRRLDAASGDDLEFQMDEMRRFRQINTLRVAAADITNAIPLMSVSDHLSDLAETILGKAVEIAWNHILKKHGKPNTLLNGEPCGIGFAVIAYGKLGGIELGYDSDLDLVFVHAGTDGETDGGKPVENSLFFTRIGQRVLHILTAHTPAGILYETDMRLRPGGSYGILVTHVDSFESYQAGEAWTWEKQALVKARVVFGDERLTERFEGIRRNALGKQWDTDKLRSEIKEMRARMKKSLLKPDPHVFDLKQGDGGMVDVEFLVQYLVLSNARKHAGLLQWTDNVRLIGTLAETGIIDDVTAHFMRKAYLTYRSSAHRLSLHGKPARVSGDRFAELREIVADIWNRYFG